MTKDKIKGLILLGSLKTIIGFILLIFSVNFGTSLADSWLFKQGGGADTSTYLIVIEGYVNSFSTAGIILFGIGLATITFAYYKILNVNE